MLGDRGYDAEAIRQGLRDRRIIPFLAKRNTEHGSGLGRWRWVVERTHSWMNRFRGILIRWSKKPKNYVAMLHIAFAFIIYGRLGLSG